MKVRNIPQEREVQIPKFVTTSKQNRRNPKKYENKFVTYHKFVKYENKFVTYYHKTEKYENEFVKPQQVQKESCKCPYKTKKK